jgi:hypothetical protein
LAAGASVRPCSLKTNYSRRTLRKVDIFLS